MTSTPPVPQATQAPRTRRQRPRYLDGPKLLRARMNARLGQSELAAELGTTQSVVSHWETGRNGTSLAQVERIATVLRVEPEALMPDETLVRAGISEDAR